MATSSATEASGRSPVIGLAASCRILLLIAQISLVSAGRVDIHRRLGIAGFLLACLMVVLGVWTATAQLARHAGGPVGPIDAKFFYIIPLRGGVSWLIQFAFLLPVVGYDFGPRERFTVRRLGRLYMGDIDCR